MTSDDHNKYLAWTFFGHAALQLLMTLIMGLMFYFMFPLTVGPGEPAPPREMFAVMFGFMFVVQFALTAPSVIAGYGLLKRKSWARIASIVAGIVASMSVPVGTAACVYSLWFFLGDSWKSVYTANSRRYDHEPRHLAPGYESRWAGYHTNEKGEVIFHPVEPPDWR